ncbi:MAG: guanine deaminase [Granulosicoccus sp.]|nr:guanine deaminase [Granulosicoccus sp.]
MDSSSTAIHASVLHCLADPDVCGSEAIQYIPEGTLLIADGHIVDCGTRESVSVPRHAEIMHLEDKLLLPGFIDTHVHYPQVDIIASYGSQLLEWLERYTFPAESRFHDIEHASDTAGFFLDELLRNGTTTALVFGTVHPESVDAFFDAALSRQLRMICGKVMMNRHAPTELLDTAESSRHDSQALIDRWHGRERLGYAVTPRFAPTSTPEQLTLAGALLDDNPGVHLHTHMAENADECDWVHSLFPQAEDYLAVYEQFDLVRRRSVFAHAVHLPGNAWKRLAAAEAAVAHCPCSNLFIGSGLFDLRSAQKHGVKLGLGTDIGGGDSFSLLRVVNEAYKVQQLQRHTLTAEYALYLATLGGARALDLDAHIGNFEPGKEADFIVIDERSTPLMTRRMTNEPDWRNRLFTLFMLGDDRSVQQTWIMGKPAHTRQP